jgi:hypothetical protein
LLSIADNLGHGAEARAALIELCATRPPQGYGEQVLKDAKIVFDALEIDRIFKKDLAREIVQRGDPAGGPKALSASSNPGAVRLLQQLK